MRTKYDKHLTSEFNEQIWRCACANCGGRLRGSREVNYCEDCMEAYRKGFEDGKRFT